MLEIIEYVHPKQQKKSHVSKTKIEHRLGKLFAMSVFEAYLKYTSNVWNRSPTDASVSPS